jgi:hypothetical protein
MRSAAAARVAGSVVGGGPAAREYASSDQHDGERKQRKVKQEHGHIAPPYVGVIMPLKGPDVGSVRDSETSKKLVP